MKIVKLHPPSAASLRALHPLPHQYYLMGQEKLKGTTEMTLSFLQNHRTLLLLRTMLFSNIVLFLRKGFALPHESGTWQHYLSLLACPLWLCSPSLRGWGAIKMISLRRGKELPFGTSCRSRYHEIGIPDLVTPLIHTGDPAFRSSGIFSSVSVNAWISLNFSLTSTRCIEMSQFFSTDPSWLNT